MKYLGILLLILALVWPGGAAAEVEGTWGISLMGSYDLPVAKLRNWYPSSGGKFGLGVLYVINDRWTAKVEGLYGKYSGGELEKRTFLWSIDKQEHASPRPSRTWLGWVGKSSGCATSKMAEGSWGREAHLPITCSEPVLWNTRTKSAA